MRELKFIDKELYRRSLETPITAARHYPRVEVNAPYVGEMARAYMVKTYGKEAYNKGYRVYTTIDSSLQQTAKPALINGLLAYDQRHGFRGPETRVEITYTDAAEVNFEVLDEFLK